MLTESTENEKMVERGGEWRRGLEIVSEIEER